MEDEGTVDDVGTTGIELTGSLSPAFRKKNSKDAPKTSKDTPIR